MEIEGMIVRDLGMIEGISKAGNPWKKHEWVLETTGQYPRKIKFTVFGDRTNTINFELGKSYVIQVDVESREFNDRWYTDLTAYNFRPAEPAAQNVTQPFAQGQYGTAASPSASTNPYQTQPGVSQNPFNTGIGADLTSGDSTEDLPF